MFTQPYPNSHRRIGELLLDAHLITPAQVQVALYDQQQYSTMRLGEIFVFRGWLNQITADFFADRWSKVCEQGGRRTIGEYLLEAGLVDRETVHTIIDEQYRNGYRFGANAVLLGFIHQETLDYFLENLFPEHKNSSPYVFKGKQRTVKSQSQILKNIKENTSSSVVRVRDTLQCQVVETAKAADDIDWVG